MALHVEHEFCMRDGRQPPNLQSIQIWETKSRMTYNASNSKSSTTTRSWSVMVAISAGPSAAPRLVDKWLIEPMAG